MKILEQEEMIDRLVPDVAQEIHGEDLICFLEYYVRKELEEQLPNEIKRLYSERYKD